MKYRQFIFQDYTFDASSQTATFTYGYDEVLVFTETFRFNFAFAQHDTTLLDRLLQVLFFLAGVSYYKAYLAPEIVVQKGAIDPALAQFLERTYQRGLGEFFFVNQLDPHTPISFPVNTATLPILTVPAGQGVLVGIGGGKDSLVSVEMLREKIDVATWSVGHQPQLQPLVERIGLPHYWVERTWDRQLLELNKQDALNGHIPISAILAAVGVIVAVLSGRRDVVVSNEHSANEPTLHYQGVSINHQYSKSLAFETDFQGVLKNICGETLRYYSLLRPYSELRISELFSRLGFRKYHDVFSSCNRAFTHSSDHLFWCGECPKCAFVFLALTPFVERSELEELWERKNLLLDTNLEPIYRSLLGIEGDKPLECVGEIKESRAAMELARNIYPQLNKYQFDLPAGYDYRATAGHAIPVEITQFLV